MELTACQIKNFVILFVIILAIFFIAPDFVRIGSLAIIMTIIIWYLFDNKGANTVIKIEKAPIYSSEKDSQGKPEESSGEHSEEYPAHGNANDYYLDGYPGPHKTPYVDKYVHPEANYNYREKDPYGFMQNEKYGTCYPPPPYDVNHCDIYSYLPFDEANSRMATIRQQRVKKGQDGWASKNSNYYKKFYGDELNQEEHKRWWGNDEY